MEAAAPGILINRLARNAPLIKAVSPHRRRESVRYLYKVRFSTCSFDLIFSGCGYESRAGVIGRRHARNDCNYRVRLRLEIVALSRRHDTYNPGLGDQATEYDAK